MDFKIKWIATIVLFFSLFMKGASSKEILPPKPSYKGEKSVEEAIKQRRTVRELCQ